jgi:hypothetical protein
VPAAQAEVCGRFYRVMHARNAGLAGKSWLALIISWLRILCAALATSSEQIMSAHKTPEQVRSKIDHPIVDGDGHWVEYDPVFSDKMRKVGGDLAADGFLKAMGTTRESLSLSPAERRHKRLGQQAFWSRQAENTLDRATAMMPKLLYDRLDELGLDFVIVYPTAGLRLPRIQDDAARRAVIRAYNIVSADYFSGLGDRLTPAAIIPMHTPDEAIAELEFVTR